MCKAPFNGEFGNTHSKQQMFLLCTSHYLLHDRLVYLSGHVLFYRCAERATVDEKFFEKICLNNNHIYCTVSFLLLQLPHRATTFDLERTVCNYRNILII